MTDVAMTGGDAKRAKGEARLIPGVDGYRSFGFPPSIITKYRYCDTLSFAPSAGATFTNVYAANGTFDPDITSTGHQPMYRDQYATIYDQYVVIGAKITVGFVNTSTTIPCVVGINGDDDSSGSSTLSTRMEQNNSFWKTLGCLGSGSDTQIVTCTFEPLRDLGIAAKDDGSSATQNGVNPTELYCFQLWGGPLDGSSAARVQATVEIEYTVKYSELQTPTQN